jgi:hypothetical protein
MYYNTSKSSFSESFIYPRNDTQTSVGDVTIDCKNLNTFLEGCRWPKKKLKGPMREMFCFAKPSFRRWQVRIYRERRAEFEFVLKVLKVFGEYSTRNCSVRKSPSLIKPNKKNNFTATQLWPAKSFKIEVRFIHEI